jgi:hypothetical protein
MFFGKGPGVKFYRENGGLIARSGVPLRQSKADLGVEWSIER